MIFPPVCLESAMKPPLAKPGSAKKHHRILTKSESDMINEHRTTKKVPAGTYSNSSP